MKDVLIDFNVKFGLEKVWRWKLWILIAIVITGVGTFLISSRIKPEFRSSASYIPPHLNSLTMLTFDNAGEKYKGLVVGSEEDLDRAIEFLQSKHVADSLARRFGLYDHYGIDPENTNKDKIFYYLFSQKNSIAYSDRSVVTIDCYDTSPDTAFMMANALLDIAEGFYENIAKRELGLKITEKVLDSLYARRRMLLDTLSVLRDKYQIFVMNNEGDPVSAIMAERMRNSVDFRQKYDHLRSMEFQLNALEYMIGDTEKEHLIRKTNLLQLPDLVQRFQKPVLATYKARPKRSVIVAVAMSAMLFFSIFVVLLFDRSKDKLPI